MKFMNQPKKSNHFKLNNLLMFPLDDDGKIKKNNWTILLFLITKQKRTLVVMVN